MCESLSSSCENGHTESTWSILTPNHLGLANKLSDASTNSYAGEFKGTRGGLIGLAITELTTNMMRHGGVAEFARGGFERTGRTVRIDRDKCSFPEVGVSDPLLASRLRNAGILFSDDADSPLTLIDYHGRIRSANPAGDDCSIDCPDPDKHFEYSCSCDHDPDYGYVLTVETRNQHSDLNLSFDPLSIPDPTAPENRGKVSGRGMLLMATFANSIEWGRSHSGAAVNMVRLRFHEEAPTTSWEMRNQYADPASTWMLNQRRPIHIPMVEANTHEVAERHIAPHVSRVRRALAGVPSSPSSSSCTSSAYRIERGSR